MENLYTVFSFGVHLYAIQTSRQMEGFANKKETHTTD